jgi:filamentous hemagglutinin family protein
MRIYYRKVRARKTEINLSPIDKMDFSKCCEKSTAIPRKTQDWRYWCRQLVELGNCFVLLYVLITSFQERVFAQVTPDSTLTNNSSVARNGNIFNINGGTQALSNLFHSFGEFSVPTGGAAIFNNALDIQNIISRVTGGSVSNIDGIIRTNGTANLFLINPNGIVFGSNARLDVDGSFVASTANALQFGNLGFFSATDKNIPSPLLTINPSALLFNQINQNAAIQNNSVAFAGRDPAGFNAFGLRVPDGKSLMLVGGNVSMDGGQLNAYGGRVELGGLAEAGTVALGVDGNNVSLRFPENAIRASVSLTNQAEIYVEGTVGGDIVVNARNLEILGRSILSGGIGRGLGTPETVAGDIMLNATGEIKVSGGSIVGNRVRLGSLGNGGNITINTGSFSLRDRAQLQASTSGQGNAGNVTVSAFDAVSLADADIFSTVEAGGVGKGGYIDINAATLSLIEGAQLQTLTRGASNTQVAGRGDAGNVNINVTESVDIAGEKNSFVSAIFSRVETGTVGNGGNITINSGSFSLRDRAKLTASTSGQGNAGNVTVRALDSVSLADNAFIFSTVEAGGVGKGGNIDINAATLSLIDGAVLQTLTGEASATQPAGRGDAGNVNVNVTGTVDIAGEKNGFVSAISSSVETGTEGNGGNITIDSGLFSLQDRAQLSASTSGQGNAGNVIVRALDAVSLAGGQTAIFSTVEAGGVGKGGNIDINATTLSLIDGAQLLALTRGQGNAGNVTVRALDAVSLAGNTAILSTVGPGGVGKGGNIDINAATLSLIDGAQLQTLTRGASNTQAAGRGDAGNVNINVAGAVDIAGQKNSFISAIFSRVETGTEGNGGNITIDSGSFSLRDRAKLTTSTSGQGNAGNVTVRAKDSVSLADNATILSTVEAGGVGKGGNIDINAAFLSLKDGAVLLTATRGAFDTQPPGQGDAGNINVKVTGTVDIAGEKNGLVSVIGSAVGTGTEGNGGNITIDSGSFSLQNGALLTAETSGQGNAGIIKVNAADFVTISGKSSNFNSGLFVNSQSPTGITGGILVTSPKVTLDNSGRLNAQSTSGNGGDINLQTDLLIMRRGVQISTNAGTAQAGGDGGNITINAPSGFILAVPSENSDITANAFTGSGGRVDIKAFGIYGIQPRESQTLSSDITASSDFGTQGTVELNRPDIDPNSGLIELPTVPVDTEVAQGCYTPSYAQSSFVITGRGGLPPNPKDVLTPDSAQIDWVSVKPSNNNRSLPPVTTKPTTSIPKRIVEATGATLNAFGQIVLTANSSTVTPHTSRQNSNQC